MLDPGLRRGGGLLPVLERTSGRELPAFDHPIFLDDESTAR